MVLLHGLEERESPERRVALATNVSYPKHHF
jgi:hypothetical protein